MKVLFISNDPDLLNVKSITYARMCSYAKALGELHIVLPAAIGSRDSQDGNLFLHPVFSSRLFRVSALAARAREIIKEKGIEIVSAQDPFEHGLAALRAVDGTPAKLHIQVHTDFLSPWFVKSGNWRSPRVRMPLLNRLRRRWADKVLPKAQGIRVVSLRIKYSLIDRYGSRIPEPSIIPITVDSSPTLRVPLPPHPFTFALITVGRLEPEKRIQDILHALKLVIKHYPVAGLIVVGEGRERARLERMVSELDLNAHVVFLGNRTDVRGLMASAQAYIQASGYEGYGRTLVEAALARIPIITTDVGVVGEVFKGYEDVLAAPVADPTALSLHIVGLIENNDVRNELVLHAEAAAKAHLVAVGDLSTRIAEDLHKTLLHP